MFLHIPFFSFLLDYFGMDMFDDWDELDGVIEQLDNS